MVVSEVMLVEWFSTLDAVILRSGVVRGVELTGSAECSNEEL